MTRHMFRGLAAPQRACTHSQHVGSQPARSSGSARRWGRWLARPLAFAMALMLLAGSQAVAQQVADAGSAAELRDADGFLQAGPGRELRLPADHASHPQTRTEWWYFTGPLTDAEGRRYGFQATWFRRALKLEAAPRESALGVRDVLIFHGALTDLSAGELLHAEASTRAAEPWGRAATDGLDVSVYENSLRSDDDAGTAQMAFRAGSAWLQLDLDLAASPVLLHGALPGLSIKGHESGQASWYYTLPAIGVTGTLLRDDGESVTVTGRAWMDHEFGSSQLSGEQVGWDWFSVALDDGSALMAYRLRLADGSPDTTSSGTLALPGQPARHLTRDQVDVTVTDTWTSPTNGATYPAAWTLAIPSADLELRVTPLLADQELDAASTGTTYWEGLCRFEGTRAGQPIIGEGYVELVGYVAPISDRFASTDS